MRDVPDLGRMSIYSIHCLPPLTAFFFVITTFTAARGRGVALPLVETLGI